MPAPRRLSFLQLFLELFHKDCSIFIRIQSSFILEAFILFMSKYFRGGLWTFSTPKYKVKMTVNSHKVIKLQANLSCNLHALTV